MAAASHLNVAPPERQTSVGITEPPLWQPPAVTMHVTRPKSAKGRTRPSLNYSRSVEAYSCRVPSSPQPLSPCDKPGSGQRADFPQQLCQPVQASPAEIPDLLQQVPVRTSCSLNKYRVLPSISRKELRRGAVEVMSEQASQLRVSNRVNEEEQNFKGRLPERVPTSAMTKRDRGSGEHAKTSLPLEKKPFSEMKERSISLPAPALEEPSEKEPMLLLAVRSPLGQRFQHHFRPTDRLETVLAVAERKNSAVYKRCSIETVEVPRRTFSDLTKSLQECAILHKSVLCILQEEPEGEL
ncbi:UBX domain-containing protein 10 [Eublepharis macularius]|uniref:UBX domain-containing protein 10 n=1 Tax=Eublepharis macularius TaxID=481883 RepID=A0AA97KK10_EUBMA|nr:UBX domain-containing protein 10 [Eublepharis macularius]XP_054858074.1 UBX domain-containing protein 10 [Eublepharis macularius]XP_054858075.1 UBX domain-containing protein 10 [Eublepharis macularius]